MESSLNSQKKLKGGNFFFSRFRHLCRRGRQQAEPEFLKEAVLAEVLPLRSVGAVELVLRIAIDRYKQAAFLHNVINFQSCLPKSAALCKLAHVARAQSERRSTVAPDAPLFTARATATSATLPHVPRRFTRSLCAARWSRAWCAASVPTLKSKCRPYWKRSVASGSLPPSLSALAHSRNYFYPFLEAMG